MKVSVISGTRSIRSDPPGRSAFAAIYNNNNNKKRAEVRKKKLFPLFNAGVGVGGIDTNWVMRMCQQIPDVIGLGVFLSVSPPPLPFD